MVTLFLVFKTLIEKNFIMNYKNTKVTYFKNNKIIHKYFFFVSGTWKKLFQLLDHVKIVGKFAFSKIV